jgi:hypothetical protein
VDVLQDHNRIFCVSEIQVDRLHHLLRVFEGAAFFVSNRSGDKSLVSTLSQSDNLSQRVIGVSASRNATVLLLERTMIG